MTAHTRAASLCLAIALVVGTAAPSLSQGLPGVPRNLTGSAAGALVTVSWEAPASGAAPTGYVLDIGSAPGNYSFGSIPMGLTMSLTFPAPPGTYYFRVHAETDAGAGPFTPEIAVTVGAGSGLPGLPRNLRATVVDHALTLEWDPPVQGAPITDYLLSVTGSLNGGRISIGPATSFSVPGVPTGVYNFAVAAVNAAGEGPATPFVTVSVGVTTPPGVPQNFAAFNVGNVIHLRWNPPTTGGPVSGYILSAGGPFGAGRVPIGNVNALEVPVPDGAYRFALTAVNEAGESPSTPIVTLSIGATSVPSEPQGFSASVVGNVLSLRWAEPAVGAPITQYVLGAAGPGVAGAVAPIGPATSLRVVVPDGVYRLAVAAENALGRGPFTATITVTVANTTPPDPPLQLTGSGANHALSLAWLAPTTGGPVTGFRLQIGTAPGDYGFYDGVVTSTSISTPIGDGTYFSRVRSENGAAASAYTPEIAVTVGTSCTRPAAPVLSAVRSGNTVTLLWTVPPGAAPIGYTLQLGSTTTDTFRSSPIGLVNTISAAVPTGVYVLRVIGAATCGLGTPSNVVTVNVP